MQWHHFLCQGQPSRFLQKILPPPLAAAFNPFFLLESHFHDRWVRKSPKPKAEEGGSKTGMCNKSKWESVLRGFKWAAYTQSVLNPMVNDDYVPLCLIIKSCWINSTLRETFLSLSSATWTRHSVCRGKKWFPLPSCSHRLFFLILYGK